MSIVNLTARQQKFFDYFNNYYQSNGSFPTMSQGSRDLKVCPTTVTNMYGALLLKGAFTGGKPIAAGNKPRRNASAVKALNLSDLKIDTAKRLRKRYTPRAIADQLSKLIEQGDPTAKKLAEMLGI